MHSKVLHEYIPTVRRNMDWPRKRWQTPIRR